jgi:hypothetical protein
MSGRDAVRERWLREQLAALPPLSRASAEQLAAICERTASRHDDEQQQEST